MLQTEKLIRKLFVNFLIIIYSQTGYYMLGNYYLWVIQPNSFMSFYQNSVINKYLKTLDKQVTITAYAKFRAHFHYAPVQDNIRGSKEEQ